MVSATVVSETVRWSLWFGRAWWIVGLALVLASLLWAALGVAYMCTCCGCCHPRLRMTAGELFWMCFVACASLVTLSMAIGPSKVAALLGWASWSVHMMFTPLGYMVGAISELASMIALSCYYAVEGLGWAMSSLAKVIYYH
jgi:hypothetical protein